MVDGESGMHVQGGSNCLWPALQTIHYRAGLEEHVGNASLSS